MATEDNDLSRLTQQWYQQWERGMTTWWDQVLDSPAFLGAMGDNLSNQAKVRGAYADMVDEGLKNAQLPSRNDLVRVLRIATLLEEKILGVEDRLLSMQDSLGRIEKEALTARIEAVESRLELKERLAALEARLASLESTEAAADVAPAAAEAAPKAAPKPTPRKSTKNRTQG